MQPMASVGEGMRALHLTQRYLNTTHANQGKTSEQTRTNGLSPFTRLKLAYLREISFFAGGREPAAVDDNKKK